jgi:hypothetical protein
MPVLLKGEVKRAGRMPALQGKSERLLQDFVATSGSSLGLDAIERVGDRFRRWGLGNRRLRSGARFPGEIEK